MPDEDQYGEIEKGANESMTVAEARHLARRLLPEILDGLAECAANSDNKQSDRNFARKLLLDFATDTSQGTESKWIKKLTPAIAAKIAAMEKRDAAKRPEATQPALASDAGAEGSPPGAEEGGTTEPPSKK